jgi:hypothetical protein
MLKLITFQKTRNKNKKYMRFKTDNQSQIYCLFWLPVFLVACFVYPQTTLASLMSWEGNTPRASGNALLSKENEPLNVQYTIRQQPDKDINKLVSYDQQEFNGTFILRQKKPAGQTTLTSIPDPLDMRILKIISKENIRCLQDYALWLKKNFQYKKDEGKDHWASPDETLDLRKGDCEDFAFLN